MKEDELKAFQERQKAVREEEKLQEERGKNEGGERDRDF